MDINHRPYSADREIEFIDGLGTFGVAEKNGDNSKTRKQLLRNYLVAAKKRTDWGSIDSFVVMDYVRKELLFLSKTV